MDQAELLELFEHLLELEQRAFAGGQYDVAYHLLMAALHCGDDLRDARVLARIERLATERLTWIDTNAPQYEHSSAAAAKRGHVSIYSMAATQAHARGLIERRESATASDTN